MVSITRGAGAVRAVLSVLDKEESLQLKARQAVTVMKKRLPKGKPFNLYILIISKSLYFQPAMKVCSGK